MDKHELAVKLIETRLEELSKEMAEAQATRLEAVEELKTTSFEPRKQVLNSVANGAWDKAVELALESLNLSGSLRVLEDAQAEELTK